MRQRLGIIAVLLLGPGLAACKQRGVGASEIKAVEAPPELAAFCADYASLVAEAERPFLRQAFKNLGVSEPGTGSGCADFVAKIESIRELRTAAKAGADVSGLRFLTNLELVDIELDGIPVGIARIAQPRLQKLLLTWRAPSPPQATAAAKFGEEVAKLSTITTLGFQKFKVSSVAFLSGMTGLTTLYLDENRLSKLEPLAGLVNLEILYLNYNLVSDITPLANLLALTHLSLEKNEVSGIDTLMNLANLISLDLSGNPDVKSIFAVSALPNLVRLAASGSGISSVAPLAAIPDLQSLSLDDNQIVDVKPLAATKLSELYLRKNRIVDMAPLAQMAQLEKVLVDDNPIATLPTFASGNKITMLSFQRTKIENPCPALALKGIVQPAPGATGIVVLADGAVVGKWELAKAKQDHGCPP